MLPAISCNALIVWEARRCNEKLFGEDIRPDVLIVESYFAIASNCKTNCLDPMVDYPIYILSSHFRLRASFYSDHNNVEIAALPAKLSLWYDHFENASIDMYSL